MADYTLLQDKAYAHILQLITSGSLETDTIYSETKLSREIGISRTPVKDALVRLSQDKYIDILPSKGFKLHRMTRSDVESTFEARAALEGFCAVRLHKNLDLNDAQISIDKMNESLILMKNYAKNLNAKERFLTYDLSFHNTLVESSHNQEFKKLFDSYQHRLYAFASQTLDEPGRIDLTVTEHETIMNAICSNESSISLVYEAVIKHLRNTKDLMLNYLE